MFSQGRLVYATKIKLSGVVMVKVVGSAKSMRVYDVTHTPKPSVGECDWSVVLSLCHSPMHLDAF